MNRIIERVPVIASAGFLLSGAMVAGAAVTYAATYSDDELSLSPWEGTSQGFLECTYQCDNSEDCGDNCKCNNSVGCVD